MSTFRGEGAEPGITDNHQLGEAHERFFTGIPYVTRVWNSTDVVAEEITDPSLVAAVTADPSLGTGDGGIGGFGGGGGEFSEGGMPLSAAELAVAAVAWRVVPPAARGGIFSPLALTWSAVAPFGHARCLAAQTPRSGGDGDAARRARRARQEALQEQKKRRGSTPAAGAAAGPASVLHSGYASERASDSNDDSNDDNDDDSGAGKGAGEGGGVVAPAVNHSTAALRGSMPPGCVPVLRQRFAFVHRPVVSAWLGAGALCLTQSDVGQQAAAFLVGTGAATPRPDVEATLGKALATVSSAAASAAAAAGGEGSNPHGGSDANDAHGTGAHCVSVPALASAHAAALAFLGGLDGPTRAALLAVGAK